MVGQSMKIPRVSIAKLQNYYFFFNKVQEMSKKRLGGMKVMKKCQM